MFDPVQLRTFLTLSEVLSFTHAAQRLGISQPTVSQHVARLEKAANRRLVIRDTHEVTLTDNGRAMAGFARTILAAHDQASAYFTGSAMAGRLRFGAADDLALTQLPRILREFRQLHPRITMELTISQSQVLHRRLLAGHLDLVFIKQLPDETSGRLVRRDRLAWVGLESMELAPGGIVPLITYPNPSPSRNTATGVLERAGRTWRVTCTTREIHGVLAAVRAGLGVTVMAQSLVPADLVIMPASCGLPELGDIDMTLVDNPRAAREPVEALSSAILGRH
ncbi:LysR substrate-binding domain-containing protein [Ruania suaedae]|uniref:LysR substrate-binding domain-containing protein n=1 Tax=Ruania suaedae TaxID=2897774 RepID=UPI001E600789|nr:LysR substrate-binding domain-containing protein [Ruania suaedae]UFU04650.1 LysR substrate-binding domain-containing protein [Ruania suaedae]